MTSVTVVSVAIVRLLKSAIVTTLEIENRCFYAGW